MTEKTTPDKPKPTVNTSWNIFLPGHTAVRVNLDNVSGSTDSVAGAMFLDIEADTAEDAVKAVVSGFYLAGKPVVFEAPVELEET